MEAFVLPFLGRGTPTPAALEGAPGDQGVGLGLARAAQELPAS